MGRRQTDKCAAMPDAEEALTDRRAVRTAPAPLRDQVGRRDALGTPRRRSSMDHIDLIAARMEQARWERGISVAELARRIGVDRKRLWRVLNGERAMRADEFVRLCAVLGLGIGRFLPPAPPYFRENHRPPSHHRSFDPPPTLSE